MSWSNDYKKSIDCDNPKGFSQKAHCDARKKRATGEETKSKSPFTEETKSGDEGLRDWFRKSKSSDGKPGWVQLGGKWAGKPCARQPGQTSTPKCGSSKMSADLSPEEEERARRRKNRLDPNQPEKTGGSKPTNVRTEEMNLQEVKDKPGKGSGKKDACYHKVKARYDVWPSAYASGALVKCRKVGAANWGTKSEAVEMIRYCPKCQKDETRNQCKYGPKYWDMFSMPSELTSNQMKYNVATVHPANEEKDHEYSMARSELATVISAVRRLQKKMKGEGNIEAWVQSKITKAADYLDTAADYLDSGEHDIEENITIEDSNGNTFAEVIDIIKPIKLKPVVDEDCWVGYKQLGMKKKGGKMVPNCVKEEYSDWRSELSEDWQKVNRQDKTDGLSRAAVDAYRRENPGSKLQTAVTEKKPKGKRAKRRANFCRRMKGMKDKLTSTKTARDPDSRINKALRRWRCN
jgi:hypothetical protein